MLVVNKAEGMKYTSVTADFYELGLGDPYVISAAHGDGVLDLVNESLDLATAQRPDVEESPDIGAGGIKIAIVGRPNVGKSTLVNTLLGEDRVIAFDMPGTTRDSIEIPFERDGKQYTLIDTAGIRRRGKVFEAIEKFSVVKTLQSISEANVVLLLLDAQQDISEQDAHIAGFVLESGRALVVGVNKWDGLDGDRRDEIKMDIERKLNFLFFAKFHFISALKSTGIGPLMKSIDAAYEAAMAKLSTPRLTRALIEAVEHQQPRRKGSIRPKLRYAHQGGQNPPIVVIHGNALEAIDDNYKRYLEKHFRETFSLVGTPLRIELRSSKNPFAKSEK
jgi:GTP-binding protein